MAKKTVIENVDNSNEVQYLSLLRDVDPELYMIKVALIESGVNGSIIPQIVRVLGNLAIGTGYGHIRIHMEARVVSQIQGVETVKMQEDVYK